MDFSQAIFTCKVRNLLGNKPTAFPISKLAHDKAIVYWQKEENVSLYLKV